jgi:hypothetical protein
VGYEICVHHTGRVLKNGLSARKPDYYSHSGPHGAKGEHHEEVGLGMAETRSIAFSIHFFLFVMATCSSWGGGYSKPPLGIYRSGGILIEYHVVLTNHASDLLSHIALRLVNTIEPYLVEQERMTNAQLLMYESKHMGQNFFYFMFF